MPWLIPKALPDGADGQLHRFLGQLEERLDDPAIDRNVVVRDTLAGVMHGRPFEELAEDAPMAAFSLDPRNITFEAEHYVATDLRRFERVKPLLWLWKCLDLTPVGQSLASGIPLRRLLAERIFARAGRNLKIFQNVEVSVGYNIEAGDDIVIHRNVLIDDIGGIELHDGCSISDYANIYSHTHDILEAGDVRLQRTVIGRGVRVAYHATVLSGTVLSDDSMLGALALATRDLAPHVIGLGIPAKPRVWKERRGDPAFARLEVDASQYPRTPEIRANPDFAPKEPVSTAESGPAGGPSGSKSEGGSGS
jgi:acetyltransferase-like isoleucine patch superfamily enzyme